MASLHKAAYYNQLDLADMLIRAGADKNLKNRVTDYCARLRLLIVLLGVQHGDTALTIANRLGHQEMIEMLEIAGAKW